jgi:hypothetical protein
MLKDPQNVLEHIFRQIVPVRFTGTTLPVKENAPAGGAFCL